MTLLHRLLPGILEAAIALIGVLIAGGLAYFAAGHLAGYIRRRERRARPAPAAQSIPGVRHQNVTSVSVR